MGLLSARQLVTIRDFGTQPMRIHVGPAGCGKTLTTSIGLGKYLQHRPVDGRGYAILGRTQQTAKRNVCNYLTKYFGDDFKYTNSKKDGTDKDALLFGHPIYLAGLNDKSSIDKIWGASLAGILGDEMTKWKEEQLLLLMSRIRGEKIPGQDLWFEGATNPDHPKHWLKKYIDNKDNGVDLIQWTEYDVIYDGAIEYYTGLRKRYKDYPSLLNRYVYGLWTAADNLIYLGFSEAYHVIPLSDLQHVKFSHFNIGIDWGDDHPTVILLVGKMPNGGSVVIKEIYIRNTSMTKVVQLVVNMVNSVNLAVRNIFVDPSAKALSRMLKEAGLLQVTNAVNDVDDGIGTVRDALENDTLYISEECINLIREFLTYGRDENGKIIKLNDDGMDALRYEQHTSKLRGGW
jgi:PBSX family phage terminase large subunit